LFLLQEKKDSENNNVEKFSQNTVIGANESRSDTDANTNIISRLFQGQFRSTLACPSCFKESHKTESFLTLPLHVPDELRRPVFVTVVQTCSFESALVRVAVRMKGSDVLQDLRISLAKQREINHDQVI
jgi:ubiquitin carboxyl-terminal hydrolase 31